MCSQPAASLPPRVSTILKKIRIRHLFKAGATFAQLSRKYGRYVVERAIREGL